MSRVVVVGAGLGGAASAARLAKLGHEVTLLERSSVIGGALRPITRDGFTWDQGSSWTTLPGALRDLFKKSGRPLARELDLAQLDVLREHRFADGTRLAIPAFGRGAQHDAIEQALGTGTGTRWFTWTDSFATAWDVVRREMLEHAYHRDHAGKELARLLRRRESLRRSASRLGDPRLVAMAEFLAVRSQQDPREMPAWLGLVHHVEQGFGAWTVPASPSGLGAFASLLEKRLRERKVSVMTDTRALDIVVTDGRATGVTTTEGTVRADAVVCAADPRQFPAVQSQVSGPAAPPPPVTHLGLRGPVPDVNHETVLHGKRPGDPVLVIHPNRSAPPDCAAWTVTTHSADSEDVLESLARHGLEVGAQVVTRIDRSPTQQMESGSPYGARWCGPATTSRRLLTLTPTSGLYLAGAHATVLPSAAFVTLTSSVVSELIGPA